MRSPIYSRTFAVLLVMFDMASALVQPINNRDMGCPRTTTARNPSALSALHNPSGPWGSRGVPSRTARESAYNVEWEPMSELERRIEDGVNFEYIRPAVNYRQQQQQRQQHELEEDDIPSARGVFVGYRFTDEEYKRLKSANPVQ